MGEFSSSLCIVYIGTTKHQCHFIVLSYQSHKIIISQIKWFECSIQFCIKNTVQKKVITLNKRLHEKKVTQSCALKLSTFFRHRLSHPSIKTKIEQKASNTKAQISWPCCWQMQHLYHNEQFASYETQARFLKIIYQKNNTLLQRIVARVFIKLHDFKRD